MTRDLVPELVSAILVCFAGGILLIVTSRDPGRNLLTRLLDRMWRLTPRVGSTSHERWLLINGIAMLAVAFFFVVQLVLKLVDR